MKKEDLRIGDIVKTKGSETNTYKILNLSFDKTFCSLKCMNYSYLRIYDNIETSKITSIVSSGIIEPKFSQSKEGYINNFNKVGGTTTKKEKFMIEEVKEIHYQVKKPIKIDYNFKQL